MAGGVQPDDSREGPARPPVGAPLPSLSEVTGVRDEDVIEVDKARIKQGLDDLRSCFSAMSQLFLTQSKVGIHCVGRFEFPSPSGGKDYLMPAQLGGFTMLKWIRSRPENLKKGLERSRSDMLLANEEDGSSRYRIPAELLSATKTALVSVLAIHDWMLRESITPLRIGIIGGGPVSRRTVEAAHEIFGDEIESISVYSPNQSGRKLAEDLEDSCGTKFSDKADLLRTCNVIISSTTAPHAVVNLEDLKLQEGIPKLVLGVGPNDVDPSVFDAADVLFSEDPISFESKTKHPFGVWYRENSGRYLDSLSEIHSAVETGRALRRGNQLSVFIPFGVAMTDAALCLSILGLPIDGAKTE